MLNELLKIFRKKVLKLLDIFSNNFLFFFFEDFSKEFLNSERSLVGITKEAPKGVPTETLGKNLEMSRISKITAAGIPDRVEVSWKISPEVPPRSGAP